MIPIFRLLICSFFCTTLLGCANEKSNVYLSDIENFWKAYDSIQTIDDEYEQIRILKEIYVNNGTKGLKSFMSLRNFDEIDLVRSINKYPKFWISIRPNTMKVNEELSGLDKYVSEFQELYPNYREANIYFCITPVRSGGTTSGTQVLIGTEIATGNHRTNVSEFPDKRLETFFKNQTENNIIPFTIHEYVHTQQKPEGQNLLEQSIYEGACDFITELILKNELEHAYLIYGRKNEEELKELFKKDMYSTNYSDWLYNGNKTEKVGDLGYFMGYMICKSFYGQANDKTEAVAKIIELNYTNESEVTEFLKESQYYN